MDDVPLFDRQPSEFTFEDFKRLYDTEVSPVTFEEDTEMYESFRDAILYGWERDQVIEGLGTFHLLSDWSGGDGKPMGKVTEHLESGVIMMVEGTYSSWDSSEWDDMVEVEPYFFQETRYREKK